MTRLSSRLVGLLLSAAALSLVSRQFLDGRASPTEQAPPDSVEALRAALSGDPASPFRWCDLGEAYAMHGDLENAEYCTRRGAALAPNVPAVKLRLCNLEIRIGDETRITACLADLLQTEPAYLEMILSDYERLGIKIP
jgi:cytochrome c-type biogenesis protein CcmH/NrfG